MNILFISSWFPHPPDNGSKIRAFNLIKQLTRRHDITLISFASKPISEDSAAEMRHFCRSVFTVPYEVFNPFGIKALRGFFYSQPRSLIATHSKDMQTLINEQCTKNDFDAVVALQIEAAVYAAPIDHPIKIFEEIEVAVFYEQFASRKSIISKSRHGLTWWKLSRFISGMLRDFKWCTVVSEQELDLVKRIDPECDSVSVVPNGVDVEFNSGDFGQPLRDSLIYPGALTYNANFDAMAFFLRDIFPLAKATHPGLSLRITGGYDGVEVEHLTLGNGVQMTGYLDDIRPAVAQSWGCVVPLRIGGGTRLKILEAMALGTPVISTSKGAEGLEVTHERNILIADEPKDFAHAVASLLNDKNLRAKLSLNGRKLVEERYSWDICAGKLEKLIYQLVENRRKEGRGQTAEDG